MIIRPAVISALFTAMLVPARGEVLTGSAAFGDWRSDRPGVERLIRPEDLPPPMATKSAAARAGIVKRPADSKPLVPPGFEVSLVAEGFAAPRTLRTAPNGDLFVVESLAGRISVLSLAKRVGGAIRPVTFAGGLNRPYGAAFYPPGPAPDYLYVAETNRVVRFPYQSGDRVARGGPEVVISGLPTGGHWTRDLVFSPDGRQLFLSIGSASNAGNDVKAEPPGGIAAFERKAGRGASWGSETDRAAVLVADPEGSRLRHFANGIRNCSGMATEPRTGDLWCATNERDGLGDNLPPDYATRLREGDFLGWPWFYAGGNGDPRHRGERRDLAGDVRIPDVLIQPHSAPLGIVFYDQPEFPPEYRGDAFVALHGSWNRSGPTGYKIVRLRFADGRPTGAYQDFVTGFVLSDGSAWGRPTGIAVGKDGALYISEDANGSIWRVRAVR